MIQDGIKITADELTNKMIEFISECDVDELCRIAEEMFGGKWNLDYNASNEFPFTEIYDLEPNDFYTGAFSVTE